MTVISRLQFPKKEKKEKKEKEKKEKEIQKN